MYYDTFFENNMGNMNNIWQEINELLHRRKKKCLAISALNDFNSRNKIVKDGLQIPSILNEHFATNIMAYYTPHLLNVQVSS